MNKVAENENPPQLRIHIDREAYESPRRTTGHALYELGDLTKDEVLFLEVKGEHEDQKVLDSLDEIDLKEDQHFYSAPRFYHVVVNGTRKTLEGDRLTFEQVVGLAFPVPPTGENIVFTVAYRRGEGNKQGTLLPGQSVKLKEGMIFNVTATDKS